MYMHVLSAISAQYQNDIAWPMHICTAADLLRMKTMAFNQIYTDDFPADLTDEKDVKSHDEIIASGKLGLVRKNGVVCRMVRYVSR